MDEVITIGAWSLLFGVVCALATFLFAPEVGGEWWPYVRVGATLVAGSVGITVGQLTGIVALFGYGALTSR